jgi:hypothetical protein
MEGMVMDTIEEICERGKQEEIKFLIATGQASRVSICDADWDRCCRLGIIHREAGAKVEEAGAKVEEVGAKVEEAALKMVSIKEAIEAVASAILAG